MSLEGASFFKWTGGWCQHMLLSSHPTRLEPGHLTPYTFRILDQRGQPLTSLSTAGRRRGAATYFAAGQLDPIDLPAPDSTASTEGTRRPSRQPGW
jgi:hypothetical protein